MPATPWHATSTAACHQHRGMPPAPLQLPQLTAARCEERPEQGTVPLRPAAQVGGYKIVFQAEPPDPRRIPPHDLLGVTVILLSCFYRDREFIRVGYYVNSECAKLRAAAARAAAVQLEPLESPHAPTRRPAMTARYDCQELNESPPEHPMYERIVRNILADKPRVTRYQIDWT